jgi:hypothetical protein
VQVPAGSLARVVRVCAPMAIPLGERRDHQRDEDRGKKGTDMRAVFRFTGHVLWAMVKGFVFTGVVAALICAAVLYTASPGHHLALDLTAVFALVISVLAGILGSAVALIYHLSHLEEVTQAIKRREAHREQARRG